MLLSSTSAKAAAARPRANVRAAPARARTCAVYATAADHQQSSAPAVGRRAALAAAALAALALPSSPALADESVATCTYATLANGLQWCDLKEGEGPSPVAGAMIRAHYRGVLASNGREFDSSYSRGRPLSFPVGKGAVIKGWDLSILGDGTADLPPMKEGGKRRVVIPAALAYGDRGAGGVIPPGASLDFVIELMPKRRN
jgi:peptidylprolyl isomerase